MKRRAKIMKETEQKRLDRFDAGRSYQSSRQYASGMLFVGFRSPRNLEYLDNKTGDDFYVLPDGTEIKEIVPWYDLGRKAGNVGPNLAGRIVQGELIGYNDELVRGVSFRRPLLGYALVLGNTRSKEGQIRGASRTFLDLANEIKKAERKLPGTLQRHGIDCKEGEVLTYWDLVEIVG